MSVGNEVLLKLCSSAGTMTADDLGVNPVVLRSRIRRLREKGFKIYGYRGRGYSLQRQLIPTVREQEVLNLLLDNTVWSKEDISIALFEDTRGAENISCIITRLRKRGYRIINRQKRGYLLV